MYNLKFNLRRLLFFSMFVILYILCWDFQVRGQQAEPTKKNGYKAFRAGNYQEALEYFLSESNKYGRNAELEFYTARCYAGLKQNAEAIKYLNLSLEDGFYEYYDLVEEPLFKSLQGDAGWEPIKQQCLVNVSKQAASEDVQVELFLIFLEDQYDRSGPNETKVDYVIERDRVRRGKVQQLIDQGKLHTPSDLRHAAWVFHHGGTVTDSEKALNLVSKAFALDPKSKRIRWLKAAVIDRYRMLQGLPQVYGTQFAPITSPIFLLGCFTLYKVDESLVTDEERRLMAVPKLADSYKQATYMHLADMYE